MTEQQMIRMIKKHGISVNVVNDMFFAGKCIDNNVTDATRGLVEFTLDIRSKTPSTHVGSTPEIAVEDYCNANNIEWDR